jgi:AbrB family looped-hinge helix DNA binding protein
MDQELYKARLRAKGQVTLPSEVREILSAEEGDDLIFRVDETGKVIVERAITIPAEQAWFWTERWQRMEREAQADIDAGRVQHYSGVEEAIDELEKREDAGNRADRNV